VRAARHRRSRPHPSPRWGLRVVLAVVVVLVVYGAFSAYRLVSAVHQLQRGVDTVQEVRGELSTSDLETTPAGPDLQAASAQFADAHRSIGGSLLAPLRLLPYVGRQLRSLDDLSGAAATVTSLGHGTLVQAQRLLAAPHATPVERTAVIRRLAGVVSTLNERVDRINLGPSDALVPVLAEKRNTFVRDLNQLHAGLVKGSGAADAVADLLDGNRTYLLLTANNAEMRDGSGMFLQAGTLFTSGGRITLGSFRSTAELASPTPVVTVTGDLEARWGSQSPGADYRELGLSPQFELNAPVAAALWKKQTGQSVDGVLTIDVAALKGLLAVTGPVSAGGTTITSANVEQTLFVTQYAGVETTGNEARREELGALGNAVFVALQKPGIPLAKVATALDDAVNGRHILAWSAHPAIEGDWQAAGAGGQLGPTDLLLGLSNKGANKLDPYQDVAASLSFAPSGQDTAVTIRATLTNTVTTTSGLPPYTIGGEPGSPPYDYTGIFTLDVPSSAGDLRIGGKRSLVAYGPDGPSTVAATEVQVAPGASTTVTWTFLLAGHHGSLRIDPSAHVPPFNWSTPGRRFTDDTAHTIEW
jgi:hypothetical protein